MFTLVDIVGALLAAALYVPVLVLPGFALARQFVSGRAALGPLRSTSLTTSLLVGYAVLPILFASVARVTGLRAAVVIALLLAVAGLVGLARTPHERPAGRHAGLAAIWLAIVVGTWIDVAVGDRLYMSLLTVDMLKHAATTRALVETGAAPFADPFFLRDGHASFYYFYFVPSAMVMTLGGGLVDARMAVAGQVFWTGLALVGLIGVLIRASGLAPRLVSTIGLSVFLMSAAGLQMVVVGPTWLKGVGPSQSNWLNDMVSAMPISLLWVPHHVAGLLASWTALLALVAALEMQRHGDAQRHVLGCATLAACGFASAFGLSVWVTFGLVLTVALWVALMLVERRLGDVVILVGVGLVSLVCALPHIVDVITARSSDATLPVIFSVRAFSLVEPSIAALPKDYWWSPVVAGLFSIVSLPFNYLFEMGAIAIGAVIFLVRTPWPRVIKSEVARLLVVTSVAGLLIGSFMKSNIGHNDLGWRVMLFAQVGALVWCAALVAPLWQRARGNVAMLLGLRVLPVPMRVAFAIGVFGVVFDIAALRLQAPLGMPLTNPGDRRLPDVDHAVRHAFGWLRMNADPKLVVQHNPDRHRAYGYALYGGHRVVVADRDQPILLGAPAGEVRARLEALIPIFTTEASGLAVAAAATAQRVDLMVVTSEDPIWKRAPRWLFGSPALYTSAHVRILRTYQIVP